VLGSEKLRDIGMERFSNANDIVELVVLSGDDAFLQILRDAVGPSRRLWHVPSAEKVGDLLVAGQVGILVLDTQVVQEAAGEFIAQIKRQFPDLVVVVAGTRDTEAALAGLVSSGVIYRFIHKPMSPARAKLFADAAVKKYQEQLSRVVPGRRRTAAGLGLSFAAFTAATVVALGVVWLSTRHSSPPVPVPPSPTVLVTNSALEAAPARREASLSQTGGGADDRERLLAHAENALLEEHLDEAATAIEAARRAGVESGRIAFLTAQLVKSRERLKSGASADHGKAADRGTELRDGSGTSRPTQAVGQDATSEAAKSTPDTTQQDLPAPMRENAVVAESDNIVPANTLTLIKSVAPSYPEGAARRALEGWVELDFTVAASGTVKNIAVRAANPAGVFDTAAESALSRWRYQPVMRDGNATDQRARIRIRFTLRN
jgi:TonB family protein